MQGKLDDLAQANDDMQNLLNSTNIATIFLDQKLHIKRFTAEATKLVKLIPSDVGRPIGDLASNLHYDELAADAAEVLRKLAFQGKGSADARRRVAAGAHPSVSHDGERD